MTIKVLDHTRMRKVLSIANLMLLFLALQETPANGQVSNDDCAGSFAQGVYLIESSNSCSEPRSGMGWLISDSTDLAVPNFPYPTTPSSCTGFSTSTLPPGNDRWYSFRVNCSVTFTAQCTDTCTISFWSGADCAMLTPLECYTLLPNVPISGMVQAMGMFPVNDTISVQISGNGSTQDVNYTICLANPDPPCVSVFVTPEPTPTTCFVHNTQILPASSSSASDGEVTIEVLAGNGPFEILWDNGESTFTLTELEAGDYEYTITDAFNCGETYSISVPVESTVAIMENLVAHKCIMNYLDHTNQLTVHSAIPVMQSRIILVDALGRNGEIGSFDKSNLISLPNLATGVYSAHLFIEGQKACMVRFFKP